MFAPTSGQFSGNSKGLEARSVFAPIKGTVRLVYEGDGQPFLIMYLLFVPFPYYVSAPHVMCLHTIFDFEGHVEMLIDVISAEENGVVTTCELTTYEPDEDEETNEIVFNPNILVSKIIMKVRLPLPLHSPLLHPYTPPSKPLYSSTHSFLHISSFIEIPTDPRANGSTPP